jgi:GNAT superfamily N-acetyltransferase
MNMRDASVFSVREYEPGDEDEIREMMGRVFGDRPSPSHWRWHYRDAPEGPAVIHLLERDGVLAGHHAQVPVSVFVEGRRLRAGHGRLMMVLPEFQGQGGMRLLLETLLATDHGFRLRVHFPTDKAAALNERYGGSRHLGRIPRWFRWRFDNRGTRLAARVLLKTGTMRLYSTLASLPRPSLVVESLQELGAEVDALAEASASFAPCIRVRDAEYLRWRWQEEPGGQYAIQAARGFDGELRGLIVLPAAPAVPGQAAFIEDLIARDADATRALLLSANDTLAALGYARVVLDYLDPRPWAHRALLRSGFLPWGRRLNVSVLSLSPEVGTMADHLESWYLTRGDTP